MKNQSNPNDPILVTELPKIENVKEIYLGRPGCMCGCNGDYAVASKFEKQCDKERGYACPEDVSDRKVRGRYKRFAEALKLGLVQMYPSINGDDSKQQIIFFEQHGKSLVLYAEKETK